MKRRQGKPTAKELRSLGINTRYAPQRFPGAPKPKPAKRRKGQRPGRAEGGGG